MKEGHEPTRRRRASEGVRAFGEKPGRLRGGQSEPPTGAGAERSGEHANRTNAVCENAFDAGIVNPPVFGPSPPWTFSALVVEPNDAERVFIASTLTSARFSVTATNNFRDARALLVPHPPFVLVTEIRLGAYNGLHLALRGRSTRPHMTVVVTSAFTDPVLQREAERLGATFVPKPMTASELLAAVYRTALCQPNPNGTVEPIRTPFERRQGERRRSVAAGVRQERRHGDRRRDITGLLFLAASHQ